MDASPGITKMTDRRWIAVAAVALALLAAFVAYAVTRASRVPPTSPAVTVFSPGSEAPEFVASRLGGGTTRLAALRGRPVVVNFFASWCPDCVAELAAFASISKATAGSVTFLGVDSSDGGGGAAAKLAARVGLGYPIVVDEDGGLAARYRIDALPVTFFLDAGGHVRGEVFGSISKAALAVSVARLRGDVAGTKQ